MAFIGKITVVEDISLLVTLKPGESGLYIREYFPQDVPDGDLEAWALTYTEPFARPMDPVAYTDVGGPPRLVNVADAEWEDNMENCQLIHETTIVMAHIYEEI